MSLISLEETITIALSVKDRHISAKWYESMLGFQAIYHADEAGWSELQTKTSGKYTIGTWRTYQASTMATEFLSLGLLT